MDGLGKTTLITQLATLNYDVTFEVDPKNDLIRQTLDSFGRNAIDPLFYQLIFLYSNLERYRNILTESNSETNSIISDRHFLEDIIFAKSLLNDFEFDLFKRAFDFHMKKIKESFRLPSLYIMLRGSFKTSNDRTNKRHMEKGQELNGNFFDHNLDFYKKLYKNYNDKNSLFYTFLNSNNIKLVEVETDNLKSKDVFKTVLNIIENELKS